MTDKIREHEFGTAGKCLFCGKTRPEVLVNELTPELCVERDPPENQHRTGYAINDFETIRSRVDELRAEQDAALGVIDVNKFTDAQIDARAEQDAALEDASR